MKRHIQKGFTLYELLITVLIVGVVLTVGIPNLSDFTRNSRVTGITNDLHGSFFLARSEAARAKQDITICASADSMAADPSCSASFDEGWIIFIDVNGDGTRDAGTTENVIKRFPAADDTMHINTSSSRFSFAPTGLGTGATFFIAMICDDRGNVTAPGGNSAARRLVVTPIGRSTIIRTTETIAASVTEVGTDC